MTLRHPRRMLAVLAAVVSVTAAQAGGATRALGVTIDNGPSGTVTSTDATFAFTARDGAGTVGFTCTLDRLTAGCTSPKTYTGLAPGVHTFAVTATDARGAHASDRRSWTISPPEAPTSAAASPAGRADAAGATRAAGEASGYEAAQEEPLPAKARARQADLAGLLRAAGRDERGASTALRERARQGNGRTRDARPAEAGDARRPS